MSLIRHSIVILAVTGLTAASCSRPERKPRLNVAPLGEHSVFQIGSASFAGSDSSMYLCGRSPSEPDQLQLVAVVEGRMTWTRPLGLLAGAGSCLDRDPRSGTLFVVGADTDGGVLLRCLSEDGEALWDSEVAGLTKNAVSVRAASDGGCVVGGTNNDIVFLAKFSSNGEQQWDRTSAHSGFAMTLGPRITETKDGAFLAIGTRLLPLNSDDKTGGEIYLEKVGFDGDLLWSFGSGAEPSQLNGGHDVVEKDNSDIVLVGWRGNPHAAAYLIGLDAQGQLMWRRTIGTKVVNDFPMRIASLSDGRLLVSAMRIASNSYYPYVFTTKENGAILKETTLLDSPYEYIAGIAAHGDTGVCLQQSSVGGSSKLLRVHGL